MKHFILLLVVVLLWGCSPQRRLANLLERYPIPADTVETIHTVYETDLVDVFIPGDTVRKETEVEVPVNIPDTTLQAEMGVAKASAGIKDNVLWLEVVQKDTVITTPADSASKTIYKEKIIKVPYPVIEKVGQFWKHGFLILVGMILVLAVLWFLLKK